jgi:hypothetical protein
LEHLCIIPFVGPSSGHRSVVFPSCIDDFASKPKSSFYFYLNFSKIFSQELHKFFIHFN